MTVIASALAYVSFSRISSTIQGLTEHRYPVVEFWRDLSEAASRTMAVAPQYAEVVDDSGIADIAERVASADSDTRGAIDRLALRKALDRAHFVAIADKIRAEIEKVDAPPRAAGK